MPPRRSPKRSAEFIREENPAWLAEQPNGPRPLPPVTPRIARLDFRALGWNDFERLCRRLALCSGEVVAAWAYGGQGHPQLGIDVLVRKADGSFEAWQSKRHESFGPADVKKAVQTFQSGDWATKAKRFVLAVACAPTPAAIDKLEEARTQLAAQGITFEPLFVDELTDQLRAQPEIILDFFSREWVESICGRETAALLSDRLARFEIADGVRALDVGFVQGEEFDERGLGQLRTLVTAPAERGNRALLIQRMKELLDLHFYLSPIPFPRQMSLALKEILGSSTIQERKYAAHSIKQMLGFNDFPIASSSYDFGIASQQAINRFKKKCDALGKFRIVTMPGQPAVVSALFHLRKSVGTSYFEIDHTTLTGPNVATSLSLNVNTSTAYHIAIMPVPAFYRSRIDHRNAHLEHYYKPIMAIHARNSGLIFRREALRYLDSLKVRLLANSASVDAFQSLKRDSKLKEIEFGDRDYRLILSKLDDNEGAIFADSEYRYLVSSGDFISDKRFIKKFWICAFLNKSLESDKEFIRSWNELFISAWTYCRDNRKEAIEYLLSDTNFLIHFEKGADLGIGAAGQKL